MSNSWHRALMHSFLVAYSTISASSKFWHLWQTENLSILGRHSTPFFRKLSSLSTSDIQKKQFVTCILSIPSSTRSVMESWIWRLGDQTLRQGSSILPYILQCHVAWRSFFAHLLFGCPEICCGIPAQSIIQVSRKIRSKNRKNWNIFQKELRVISTSITLMKEQEWWAINGGLQSKVNEAVQMEIND